jgi:hypothetical protein
MSQDVLDSGSPRKYYRYCVIQKNMMNLINGVLREKELTYNLWKIKLNRVDGFSLGFLVSKYSSGNNAKKTLFMRKFL